MARRLNPNSDAWGGAWGSASAWGGTWGWSWGPLHEVDEPVTGGKRRRRVTLAPAYAPTPRPIQKSRRRQQQIVVAVL